MRVCLFPFRLHSLGMLGEAERETLIRGLNNTKRPFPENKLIHELVEETVRHSSPYLVPAIFMTLGARCVSFVSDPHNA